eukprot:2663280-Alexandrium_andersonii.AAC.1
MLPEIKYRIRMAEVTFKKLHMVWRSSRSHMPEALKLRVYVAVIRAKLTYGLGVGWCSEALMKRLD